MKLTRIDIEASRYRALNRRRSLRDMLLNITTVDGAVFRGARVCLHKQNNENSRRPHFAYYFSVILDGKRWKSCEWQVLIHPTKMSNARRIERFNAAVTMTMTYLLALPEREPPRCELCGGVITRAGRKVRYCSSACQKAGTVKRAYHRKRSA